MASSSVIVPASAAAAISPTEWPATKDAFTSEPSAWALIRLAATIKGCALAVSLISSASATVPKRSRSRLIALE